MDDERLRRFRLLPSESVLWEGRPRRGVPRDRVWSVGAGLALCFAIIAGLFAGLLADAGLPGVRSMALFAAYLCALALGVYSLPQFLRDPCEYVVGSRQIVWRRGMLRRTLDRAGLTYARIHWHRSVPGVGHLELVRAVPFGPLSRRQRIIFHDIEAPDRVLSIIRGQPAAPHAGYGDVRLTDRLDPDEVVVWGAAPTGLRIGFAELLTAGLGVTILGVGAYYTYRTGHTLLRLEELGLRIHHAKWLLLFSAIALSATVMWAIGAWLLWAGVWGARAEGSHTEYVLTDRRLLIRRGRTELSVDRNRIIDVADIPASRGLHNLVLILDSPDGRALDDSGAMASFAGPARATVPPVLYEIEDAERVRALLLSAHPAGGAPPVEIGSR